MNASDIPMVALSEAERDHLMLDFQTVVVLLLYELVNNTSDTRGPKSVMQTVAIKMAGKFIELTGKVAVRHNMEV